MSAKRNDKFTIFLTIEGIKNVPKFGKSACVCVCVCRFGKGANSIVASVWESYYPVVYVFKVW